MYFKESLLSSAAPSAAWHRSRYCGGRRASRFEAGCHEEATETPGPARALWWTSKKDWKDTISGSSQRGMVISSTQSSV